MPFFGRRKELQLPYVEHDIKMWVTPDGVDKLSKLAPDGFEYMVLAEVKRQQPCTVNELLNLGQIKLPDYKLREVCRILQKGGYITTQNPAGR